MSDDSKQVVFTWQKIAIAGILLIIIFSMITFGVITFMLRQKPSADPNKPKTSNIGPSYSLETFNVNLADADSKRFLKATLSFELSTSKLIPELEKRQAQIRDIIIAILREKKASDLKVSSGDVPILKNQIKQQVNAVVEKGEINAVYFTEFIVQ